MRFCRSCGAAGRSGSRENWHSFHTRAGGEALTQSAYLFHIGAGRLSAIPEKASGRSGSPFMLLMDSVTAPAFRQIGPPRHERSASISPDRASPEPFVQPEGCQRASGSSTSPPDRLSPCPARVDQPPPSGAGLPLRWARTGTLPLAIVHCCHISRTRVLGWSRDRAYNGWSRPPALPPKGGDHCLRGLHLA